MRAVQHHNQSGQISVYPKGHTFHGVNTSDPVDNAPSYVAQAFQTLISGPHWTKGSKARETFAGLLISGADILTARIQTIYTHGI